ncbi:hypothetical protein, partial [Staphylococcus hominis]
GYKDAFFKFDIDNLYDDGKNYVFNLNYEISSLFVKNLITQNKATLVFILSSQDNYFKRLTNNQKQVIIPKSRVSLSNRTTIQLHIQSLETINMEKCEDLQEIFKDYKEHIIIDKHKLIGYSNVVKYQGTEYHSSNLFKLNVNKNYKNAFEVEIDENAIILKFNSYKHLVGKDNDKNLLNIYIYIGLNRAINKFILNNNIENEEFLQLDILDDQMMTNLDSKLLKLMLNKGIKDIDYESLDDVISKVSNNIIERYTNAMEEIIGYGG